MAASKNMAPFWVAAPCSVVHIYRPEDGRSRHLRNLSKHQPDYTAQQPRRQSQVIIVRNIIQELLASEIRNQQACNFHPFLQNIFPANPTFHLNN
jgi:hypothetical protein